METVSPTPPFSGSDSEKEATSRARNSSDAVIYGQPLIFPVFASSQASPNPLVVVCFQRWPIDLCNLRMTAGLALLASSPALLAVFTVFCFPQFCLSSSYNCILFGALTLLLSFFILRNINLSYCLSFALFLFFFSLLFTGLSCGIPPHVISLSCVPFLSVFILLILLAPKSCTSLFDHFSFEEAQMPV